MLIDLSMWLEQACESLHESEQRLEVCVEKEMGSHCT
jgi:hypothetical protein